MQFRKGDTVQFKASILEQLATGDLALGKCPNGCTPTFDEIKMVVRSYSEQIFTVKRIKPDPFATYPGCRVNYDTNEFDMMLEKIVYCSNPLMTLIDVVVKREWFEKVPAEVANA